MSSSTPKLFQLLTAILICLLLAGCGFPHRSASYSEDHGHLRDILGFEGARAVDGYASASFQESFDQAITSFAATPVPADGRRDYDMLVLSSGGVNGAFGAGILAGWEDEKGRPDFWLVTGVSVGALMAPFVFAGPEFDERLEDLFRRIRPDDLHLEKGVMTSVLWDESLMDNSPLRKQIAHHADHELLRAVAKRHAAGRRCYVGSTNLDSGQFVVWDLGAIASRGTDQALELFRLVLEASAAIPVVYPPVRFVCDGFDELHADGAVVRPLFMPQNVFDGYLSADRAKVDWDNIDATMYVIHNGSLLPRPVEVQRDTLAIAIRTVTMMSYTMVSDHILHLYMLSRAWGAGFQFLTLPDGLELSVDSFTPEDTERLFLLGQGLMERDAAWTESPPGYVVRTDLNRIAPTGPETSGDSMESRLDRIENSLEELRRELRGKQ
ncbi:MAG: patatin-like phospholipase family protein [Planctomycetota bacterium]|jgi:hypothetical protein